MSKVEILKVNSKKDLMQFIKLPWKIYKNDKNWVPHLILERKQILDKKKNPFFKHGDMQLFLAKKDEEIVGRIAAIVNDLHNEVHNEKIGFFGFFESIDDTEVSDKLLETAKNWLLEKGLKGMRGPANPSSNDEWAALLEGYDDTPSILMPYNPPYYHKLFENFGLTKIKDLYAYIIANDKLMSSEKLVRGAELVKKRNGVTVRKVNMKNFAEELEKYKYVYDKAWAPNWGFVPLTNEEIDSIANELKPLIDEDLVLFMEKGDEIVGAALALPDYNQILRKLNGRLFPFGIFKFLLNKKKINRVRILTLGIIPKYQKRGLDALFYYEIAKRAEEKGILLGEASWILEDNEMMNRGAKMMNGDLYKKYRVYHLDF